jgi:hypothetical protein
MKKLITAIACVVLLSACKEKGEVVESPSDFIIIHGKTYKLMKVVPAYGERAIWIMYPKDSADSHPTIINYEVSTGGKNNGTSGETMIKVD